MAEEEIPRDPRWAIPLAILGFLIVALVWFWDRPTVLALGLISLGMFVVLGLIYLGLSYAGPKSRLYGLQPITSRMPAVFLAHRA